jgi:hypothetical protein
MYIFSCYNIDPCWLGSCPRVRRKEVMPWGYEFSMLDLLIILSPLNMSFSDLAVGIEG